RMAAGADDDLVDALALGDRGDALGDAAELGNGAERQPGARQRLDRRRHRRCAALGAQGIARGAAGELADVAAEARLDVEQQGFDRNAGMRQRADMQQRGEGGLRAVYWNEDFHCVTSVTGLRLRSAARPST